MSTKKKEQTPAPDTKAINGDQVDAIAVVADPKVEAVIEPVVATDATLPTVAVERTEIEPLVEPVAITPHIVFEQNAAVPNGHAAPEMLITKSDRAKRVEVICDGMLGHKMLPKGSITDDAEYVALLKTERGQRLVREVK